MKKHTEGPWKVRPYGSDGIEIVADYADNFPVLFQSVNGVSFHAGRADAQLMACAPELLAALKRHFSAMSLDSGDHGDYYLEILNLIEKAEGR